MLDNRRLMTDILSVLQDAAAATVTCNLIVGYHGLAVPVGAAAGTAATAAYFDTGGGFTEGKLVIDIEDVELVAGEMVNNNDNQRARFSLQGSNTVGFATYCDLASMFWGVGDTGGGTAGLFGINHATSDLFHDCRYILPFNNMYGTRVYRYLRVFLQYRGTWATGLSYKAFLSA